MKWIGIALMSGIMGIFFAVMAQMAFPDLTQAGFMAAAVLASVTIFAIMTRLTLTAGTIEVIPPNEWELHQLEKELGRPARNRRAPAEYPVVAMA